MRTRAFPFLVVAASVLVGATTAGAQQLPGSEVCITNSYPQVSSSCTVTRIEVPGATGTGGRGTSAHSRMFIAGSSP